MALSSRRVQKMTPAGRVMRRPSHPFQVRKRPWQITPFFIAPVLPGETMKNLLMQTRCISDPIKSRLVGWWNEYYFFYIKHRDLAARDEFVQMVLNPDWDKSNVDGPASVVNHYYYKGVGTHIDWVDHCLKEVVSWYFRETDEAFNADGDGLPHAAITGNTWLDSAVPHAAGADFFDVLVDGADGSTPDGNITVGEMDASYRQYEFLRQNFAVDMTYEEFLQSYGVRSARVELHKPELVRFVREWTYPISAIDPTDGSAASAVQWSPTVRADKDRFFSEPGFLLGVTVARPKVYLGRQKGSASALLESAYAWLPAVLTNDPRTSLLELPDNDLLGDNTDADGAWVDMRDLFLYGEQFLNFDLAATDANIVALPTVGMETKYASLTDADALFVDAAGGSKYLREDGIVSLQILGSQVDQSA